MKLNLMEINNRIRQRPPFQMIERVTELEPGVSAVGIKNVSVNEPYFSGHFPDAPIMPGVLIEECAAQLCSLVMEPEEDDTGKLYVLLKVKDFKFLKPVVPGDRLEITSKCVKAGTGLYEFDCTVRVDSAVKAKGTLLFTSISKEGIYD